MVCAALVAGCYDIADYDEFPGWPDHVPRDTDLDVDTGEIDTGEPDTGEPDTGEPDTGEPDTAETDSGEVDTSEPDTDSIDTETDIDTDEPDCDEWDPGESAVDVTAFCGEGELNSFDVPFTGDTALRIIGIYETDAPHHEMGDCEVQVDLQHDVALVFVAYEPVHWIVTDLGSGEIVQIIASGYYPPNVTAPDGVPVEIVDPYEEDWGMAFDFDDYEAHVVAASAEAATGLELTSFHGCYQSTWFEISEGCDGPPESPWPDCTVEGESFDGPDVSALDGVCEDVTSESYYCLALAQLGDVVVVGLDTGEICTVVDEAIESPTDVDSIAWLGQYLYSCPYEYNKLKRVDLTDGAIDEAFVWCGAIAGWNGGLLTKLPGWFGWDSGESLWFYPTFLDAQCQDPAELAFGTGNSRFTVYDDTLYSAWHSTDEIDVNSLPYGADLGTIFLEDYDTWVNGMSVIDGELLVLSATWPEDRIAVFDMGGGLLWDVPVSTDLGGLVCLPGN